MKYYYARFKKTRRAVEVEFPDLKGCVTFADTWEEAIENATDVLAGWLANADAKFLHDPSTHEALLKKHPKDHFVPIPVDPAIIESYQGSKRFNVIFPASLLVQVDSLRKARGLKRSSLIRKAIEEYLAKNAE